MLRIISLSSDDAGSALSVERDFLVACICAHWRCSSRVCGTKAPRINYLDAVGVSTVSHTTHAPLDAKSSHCTGRVILIPPIFKPF